MKSGGTIINTASILGQYVAPGYGSAGSLDEWKTFPGNLSEIEQPQATVIPVAGRRGPDKADCLQG
jgi:hypothetical protein